MTTSKKTTVATPVAQQHVIVCNSWGNYHVYPGTIDSARQTLLDKIEEVGSTNVQALGILRTCKALAATPEDLTIPYLVTDDVVLRAMKDLLSLEVGQESRALYRLVTTGPLVKDSKMAVTKAMRDELVLWSFDTKFDANKASADDLQETRPEAALSFMAGLVVRANGHPIEYVYDTDMGEAEELQQLLHGAWKPTAHVGNVVQRYLTALDNLSHRDERYHLGTLERTE